MATVAELLQTDDPDTQAERVQRLLNVVATPPLVLTILFNPARQAIELAFPGQMSPEQLHFLLDAAHRTLVRMEVEAEKAPKSSD